MADAMKEANEFVRTLREQREAYQEFTTERVSPLFLDNDQRERRPPRHFKDSSYLYARSYDGDAGSRPFSNKVFWLSPDITVSPVSSLTAYTTTLNAGETYILRCTLRNRGDLAVPSAKVEFWLTDPTLGFDTRFATHLTFGKVPAAWVSAGATRVVDFNYTVPPTETGHKCLFARTFSFSPLERPIDLFALDPTIDRHVAQLNLNIVQQGQPFQFNWIHAPNAHQTIEFVPMELDEVFFLRHPILAEARPAEEFPRRGWERLTQLELSDTDAREIDVAEAHNGLRIETRDAEGVDLPTQQELRSAVRQVLQKIDAGTTRMAEHRDLFARFSEVTSQVRRSTFRMEVPDLGLNEGQMVGVHLRAAHLEGDHDAVVGGMTFLIVGGR